MLHVVWALRPRVRLVPIVAEVLIVAVADSAIAAWRPGLLDSPHHSGGESGSHQRFLPPAGGLVLRKTVEDDGVEDGVVGADPVADVRPVLPLVLGLVLDPAALDAEPDLPPDPVLVGDVLLSVHRVHLLLVQLHGDPPGLVAPHLVELRGVRTVHSHQALQSRPGHWTLHGEVSVDWQVAPVLGCVGQRPSQHSYKQQLSI